MKEINKLVQKHKLLKEQMEYLTNRMEAVKAEIRLHLKEADLEKYEDPEGNVVTCKMYSSKRFNKDKFIELYGINNYDKVVKTTKFVSLRITPKEVIDKLKEKGGKK